MQNISIARWKGRIEAAFDKLLTLNGLRYNTSIQQITDDQWPSVLFGLSQRVGSAKQKGWCVMLLAKSAEVYSKTADPNSKRSVNDLDEKWLGECEVMYWYEKDKSNWGEKILADVDYLPEIDYA